MHPVELIDLQVTLEYQLNGDGFLVPFPGSAEQACLIIYKYGGDYRVFMRHDLLVDIRAKITEIDPEILFHETKVIKWMLVERGLCESVEAYKSYHFDLCLTQIEYPDVVLHEGCFVVIQEERPVSWAWSVRSNERCAEVAVETLNVYRRRGYAR
jgi:hypothetical protein